MTVVEGGKKTGKAGGDAPLGTLGVAWGTWDRSGVAGLGVNAQGKCGWAGWGCPGAGDRVDEVGIMLLE